MRGSHLAELLRDSSALLAHGMTWLRDPSLLTGMPYRPQGPNSVVCIYEYQAESVHLTALLIHLC